MKNIMELKHYSNLKNSGQSLITEFLKNFLSCEVRLQQVAILDFQEYFKIDILSNIKRNCYKINDTVIAIIIKVYENNEEIALMPVILEGNNVNRIDNIFLESVSNVLSKQMTLCYNNSFHSGTLFFGRMFESLIVSKCICGKNYDYSRIMYLIDLLEKLSTTTFEGNYFTTGLILSRSLYAYNGKNGEDRKGILIKKNESLDLVKVPNIDKRFWYLVDGKESFYIMDQRLIVNDVFVKKCENNTWENYFDSYLLTDTLLGDDVAFRVIGANEISIVNPKGIEFVKIENKWRLRNYNILKEIINKRLYLEERVIKALIYYILICSSNHNSSIIWIPEVDQVEQIENMIATKTKLYKISLNIVEQSQAGMIYRILSSDGVTIVDKNGNIMYCGAIVKLDSDKQSGLMGTGETAAKILSDNGIAIKISQDGNIKIFTGKLNNPTIY